MSQSRAGVKAARPILATASLSATGASDYRESMRPGEVGVDVQLHDLYAQAQAARAQSRLLVRQLRESQRRANENWQLTLTAWHQAERIRAQRLATHTEPERLRWSAYARLQARLASLPVIEQAKGIIMAKYGWPEDQAFDALRRASQRENVKVRDLAASIVARTVRQAPARRQPGPASTAIGSDAESTPRLGPGGSRDRYRTSA
jgi:ANTAR domain